MNQDKSYPGHVHKAMRFEYPHLAKHAQRKKPISHKTIFYMKEYGPHSHIIANIVKESLKVLIFASIISSIGGAALEGMKTILISLTPLIILLPALNDMIGDFGTVVASRFSTMLHEGKIKGKIGGNKELSELFVQIILISVIIALLAAIASLLISHFSGFDLTFGIAMKIIALTLVDVVVLVCLIFSVSVFAGLYFFKKNEDPNNFLIPITTSIADFGNMILLSVLVLVFF